MSQDHPDTARKVVAAFFLSLDGVAEAPAEFLTTWPLASRATVAA
jgi:hypothetical protein